LAAASDEQYESIPDDEIALLVRKFRTLHKFHKERRRSLRGCFECDDTTHFIADWPKRKKLDPSNKYSYTNRNDSNSMCNDKKKYHFGDKKKMFQKIMSRACAALSDFDFSSDNSSSSEEDDKPKSKKGDFTDLSLMGKSSRNISDPDSDVSDDLSLETVSLRITELENALCNQEKMLCKVFHENKKLNIELASAFSEIASLRSVHDDMSAKLCDNCKMMFQKIMSQACAALSDFDFSSDDSSSSEEDEKPKSKKGDFNGLFLMGKSSRNISDPNSDVSDDLSPETVSLRITKLENALCNQDKMLCKVFRENKKLNIELESAFSKIASLRSVHDDMCAKLCDNCKMIVVNYANMWLVRSHVASLLDGTKLELRELKACSMLIGACTSCPVLRSDLEASAVEIKDLKHNLDHSSRYTILSPPCVVCGSLKGKLLHATKENSELK
jgi:hypothetical protein